MCAHEGARGTLVEVEAGLVARERPDRDAEATLDDPDGLDAAPRQEADLLRQPLEATHREVVPREDHPRCPGVVLERSDQRARLLLGEGRPDLDHDDVCVAIHDDSRQPVDLAVDEANPGIRGRERCTTCDCVPDAGIEERLRRRQLVRGPGSTQPQRQPRTRRPEAETRVVSAHVRHADERRSGRARLDVVGEEPGASLAPELRGALAEHDGRHRAPPTRWKASAKPRPAWKESDRYALRPKITCS